MRVTPPELARDLAETDEYRMELKVEQVAPRFAVPGNAYIVVRPGSEASARAAHEAMSDRLHGVVKVKDAASLTGDWYAGLPKTGVLVEIGHDSDRSYAGYGNLIRAIDSLAPWLEDARFFISEDYSTFVDDLRIAGGELAITRTEADDEFLEAKRRHFVELARKGDRELGAFAAWELAIGAGYAIPDREGYEPEKDRIERAKRDLETALELAPDDDEVMYQQGRLARMRGDHATAAKWFARVAAADGPKLASRATTMAATMIAGGMRDAAAALLARDDSRVSSILRGHLTGDMAAAARASLACSMPGEREALVWTLAGAEILHPYAAAVAKVAIDKRAAAQELFGWAELYRIRTVHGIAPKLARPIADALYDAAIALDPLDGEIAVHRVFHDHGMNGKHALAGFLAVLDAFPAQGEALFWAMSALRKQEEWRRAADLGRRYIAVAHTRGSYERNTASAMVADSLVHDANDRMIAGDHGEEVERTVDAALALTESSSWEGALLAKADLLSWRREHEAALPWYERAVQRKGDSVYAWSGKGSCLSNLGRYPEALECYAVALKISKTYWHVHAAKACTLARSGGSRAEVLRLARRAIKLEPGRRAQIIGDPDLAAFRDEI